MRIKYRKKTMIMEGNGSVLADSLPDDIIQAIIQNRTSLGNNPAIPDIYDVPYMLKAANSEFESAKKALKEIGSIDYVGESTIMGALASLILKCKKIETPYRRGAKIGVGGLSSLHVFWVGMPSFLKDVFSFTF